MDEQKKYASFLIPRRDQPETTEARPPVNSGAAGEASFSGGNFAEIEFGFDSGRAAADKILRFYSAVSQPEPVEQRPIDPIRQKFVDMRRLVSARPFARDDSELFYRQAKFMADFKDNYQGDAKFSMYYPSYQHMGYEQLRTYFTWRAKARGGDMPPVSVSYLFLYIYELLNNIGVGSPAEGLDKLIEVWNTCLKFGPALENYMPRWFKDYHIYYDLPQSFTDFVKKHDLHRYFSAAFLFDKDVGNSLELWNSISGYDVKKSRFYNDGNEQLLSDCFDAVIDAIYKWCAENNIAAESLFIYSISRRMPWRPFKQALFHQWMRQPDRKLAMPGQERYYCKGDRWSANLPIYYSTQKDCIAFILKKTEACLRQTVKYKYKLSTETQGRSSYYSFEQNDEYKAMRTALDGVIEKAVSDFHRNLTRTVVTVDHSNLARIRKEAQGTQEKLIVQDDHLPAYGGTPPQEENYAPPDSPPVGGGVPDAPPDSPPVEGWRVSAGVVEPPVGGGVPDAPPPSGWASLKNALSAMELEALSLVLQGGADIKAFADENDIMLEVLADSINEKSADHIGDSILEVDDGMSVYDEYRKNIEDILAML
ncbi:MAG: TerB N-terminal domain-containing protein [Oscillospiraceae bacterium]|jgi:hypothetical protein|nr:TerB N-terminal domain-containing protein [Oscillospiraceae bacterium]